MDASYNIVLKVLYGVDLRRFNARVVDGEIDIGMNGLREKINYLFGFTHDVELMLTYVDEDCDIVGLVDDDDLRDVVRQSLNPVRISVKLKSEKDSKISNGSSRSSTTQSKSSKKKVPLQNLKDSNAEVKKTKKTTPEAAGKGIDLLYSVLSSKAPGVAAPIATEPANEFAKLGVSFRPPSDSQAAVENGSSSNGVATSSGKSGLNPTNGEEEKPLRKDENVCKLPTETEKGKEKAKAVADSMGTSYGKAPESSVVPPAFPDCGNYGSKKEKLKEDKHQKPHMPVRKLAGSYTVLPSGTQPEMVGGNVDKPNPMTVGYHGGRMGYVSPLGLYGYPGSVWSPPPVDFSRSAFTPMYLPLYSGASFGSTSASSQLPSPVVQPERSYGHHVVQCDGCDFYPIVGPRYKSKVRNDYDLCAVCFSQIGNETDYIKMDLPAYPHLMPFKQMSDSLYSQNFMAESAEPKLDSRFVVDVNIMDGTVMAPSTPFTKTWQMKNNGTTVWPEGTRLLWIGGDQLSNQFYVEVAVPPGGLPVDQELQVSVDFTAPKLPGGYISYWRLVSPSGQKFGQRVWVIIQVDASLEAIEPDDSLLALNLNSPPKTTNASTFAEPIPENSSHTEPTEKTVELINTVFSYLSEVSQEMMKLPDTSLASDGLSTSANGPEFEKHNVPEPSAPNMVSGTTTEASVLEPSLLPPISASELGAAEPTHDGDDIEERLLWELEQMGFHNAERNKEALRISGYDLERAVDELCAVSDWDPIIDELVEMGFRDTEMNKALLKKNGGSIKRVVMDLISEKNDD